MSYNFTFSGRESILQLKLYPPIILNDDEQYELGLINLATYHTIANVDETNNLFHFENKVFEIPVGTYEVEDLATFLHEHVSKEIEYHSYLPYANSSLNKSDEVRIPIQTQNVYTYPAESFLELEGVVLDEQNKASGTIQLTNMALMFLFDEIRYEIAGVVVDRVRNPGLTSLMKGYVSFTNQDCTRYQNAGWNHLDYVKIVHQGDGHFNACIPLKILMGVFEDFRKVVVNVRQELTLIRSFTDNNSVFTTKAGEKPQIRLDKIVWKVEHVQVDDQTKLQLLSVIEKGRDLTMSFRGWELHEYPLLNQTKQHTWNVKAVNQLEKPRYIIFGFQTNRKNQPNKDCSMFDHCQIRNFKVHLNSEVYPYDNLNLNFSKQQYALLYEMYARFQQSYYYKDVGEPCFTLEKFIERAPLIVIDCCYQMDTIKNGSVDIRLEWETDQDVSAITSAYLLILHDKKVKYNPLTSTVKIL
ncbi:unnamed protein product [Brassicogethes aeneus]|uniref:Double jelly roll-like domain-containing protein n=1 Tax=Brassicogethes aeneus TaxID=1431903 RepID=A0A9P0FPS1_BRAAE|nr:unnamed protein product [Brassicogethes aeneus]